MLGGRPASVCLAAVAVLFVLAGCGGDEATPDATTAAEAATPAPEAVELKLEPVHDSGLAGTASLTPGEEDSFDVVLEVTGAEDGQQAHIHDVSCAQYADIKSFNDALATVVDSLKALAGGRSETNVIVFDEGLAARTTGGFSINVHEKAYPYDATACGDIPKR